MAIAYPLVNGFRHSYAQLEIRVAGSIVLGITELNYSWKLEPAVVRGAGALPIGLTLGNADYDADFSILLEEFNSLMDILGAQGPALTVPFDIVAAYDPTIGQLSNPQNLSVLVDTVKGCRITNIEHSSSSGSTDAIVRKCTVKPLGILINGVSPMPEQPTAAA